MKLQILLGAIWIAVTLAAENPQAPSGVVEDANNPFRLNAFNPYNRNINNNDPYYRNSPYFRNKNGLDSRFNNRYDDSRYDDRYNLNFRNNPSYGYNRYNTPNSRYNPFDQYSGNNYYNRSRNYNENRYYPNTGEAAARILNYQNNINPDGSYEYSYNTDNGISASESGIVRPLYGDNVRSVDDENIAETVEGYFSYTSPEGVPVSVKYVADEGGFRPVGDVIPRIGNAGFGKAFSVRGVIAPLLSSKPVSSSSTPV